MLSVFIREYCFILENLPQVVVKFDAYDRSNRLTAFKTTSMRIRGTSVEELEEAGLATDGLIESNSVDAKYNASTADEKTQLHDDNVALAEQIQQVVGELYYDSKSGIWHIGKNSSGTPLYQYFGLSPDGSVGKKKYHSGGYVDGTGAINDSEVLAVLKRGELVLNDGQQANLKTLLNTLYGVVESFMSFKSGIKLSSVNTPNGDFNSTIEVNITHNGSMSDADAKRYGDIAGEAALEKLRTAFSKRGIR